MLYSTLMCSLTFWIAVHFGTANRNNKNMTGPMFVVIAACSRSTDEWKSAEETSLVAKLLPSVERCVLKDELLRHKVALLIGYDVGDRFWENQVNRKKTVDSTFLEVNFMAARAPRHGQIPFNIVLSMAFAYGADYIVRVNDDTEFTSKGFVTLGISALQSFHPPNVGVVGPRCTELGGVGNKDILTHDMVHKTHLEIFENYYPDEFDNWWIDDWISLVYGPGRTQRITSWEVKHHMNAHGTRYKVDRAQAIMLTDTLVTGKALVRRYLRGEHRVPAELHLSRLSSVLLLDGPISRVVRPNETLSSFSPNFD